MSDWIKHDGKGIPKDAIPGVTLAKLEAGSELKDARVWPSSSHVYEWDWSFYGKPHPRNGAYLCARVIAYRNPSTKAIEDLKAMITDPTRVLEDA